MGMFDWDSSSGNSLFKYRRFEGKRKTVDDYALAYVGVGMVEIVIVSLAPELMMTGQHWLFYHRSRICYLIIPKIARDVVKAGIPQSGIV
jgi:hypothetical protein